jgi:hypothetical protein
MRIAGVLANRVHEAPPGGMERPDLTSADRERLGEFGMAGGELARRLGDVWERALYLHRGDVAALAGFADAGLPVHRIPHFSRGLSGLEDLEAFASLLSSPAA